MTEPSGQDCGGEALPPAASSVASEGKPQVHLGLPKGGEKILQVSFQEECILINIFLDSVHLSRQQHSFRDGRVSC